MNWVVPRWALGVLIGIAMGSVAVGFVAEQTAWAAEHPFTLNLLSSLAGFGASLAFASVVLNKIARRQYWSAELDRRTRAAMTLDLGRRELARYFDLSQMRSVTEQLKELGTRRGHPSDESEADIGEWVTRPDAFAALEAHVADAAKLERRLAFVADGELIYRSDRLVRKWAAFSAACSDDADTEAGELSVGIIDCGIALAEALDSLNAWVLQAPDRKMKAAVQNQAFRSDLDRALVRDATDR